MKLGALFPLGIDDDPSKFTPALNNPELAATLPWQGIARIEESLRLPSLVGGPLEAACLPET